MTYISNLGTAIVYNFRNCRSFTTDFVTIIFYFVTCKVKYNYHFVTNIPKIVTLFDTY